MPSLTPPAGFPFPAMVTDIAPNDTMFDGSTEHYLSVGLSAMRAIEGALAGRPAPRRILDLPCGHGRVTRLLRARFPAAEITCSDIDHDGVAFTADRFGARAVFSDGHFPTLELGARFDLIWIGSLLTHLSELMARQMLDCMVRHMAPGAVLVVSSHGEFVEQRLRSWDYGLGRGRARTVVEDYERLGYGYRDYPGGQGYGISLISRDWLARALDGSPLRLVSYADRGWDDHQDVMVLRLAPDKPRSPLGTLLGALAGRSGAAPEPRQPAGAGWFEARCAPPVSHPDTDEAEQPDSEPGFDAAWYLSAYPDVAGAVADGTVGSALAHFRAHGLAEARWPSQAAADAAAPVPAGAGDTRRDRVSEVWSSEAARDVAVLGQYWLAHPMVRDRVNRLATGRDDQDAYGHLISLLATRGMPQPIGQALSLGCGFGALERDLLSRGLVTRMQAIDLADGAILEARRLAAEAGLADRVEYQVADLEVADFPDGGADVVFAHSSVHHVDRLEELFAAVTRTLKPGGIFHLHEFVGPTRFQWTDAQLELGNALLDSLPERLRRLPDGTPKGRLTRPTIEQMLEIDPSEAIRAADIVPLMREHFTVIEERRLGGALLHLVLGDIAQNFRADDAGDRAELERLFAAEDRAMAEGRIGSDFMTITAVAPA